MDISIETFDGSHHSAEEVARLIYQADPSLMRFVFGDEENAAKVIGTLVGLEHNEYAGPRVTCAVGDGRVVGVIAGLTGAEKLASKADSGREWGRALGIRGMARALRWGPRLEKVATADLADNEFYISALTVDERLRGRRIGSRLLESVLDVHDVVVTDVNVTKDDSIRFYKRHGFEIVAKMTFEHKGELLGNYQIRREVS